MNNNIDQTETIDEQTKKLRLKKGITLIEVWVKAITNIKSDEEIFVHYGVDFVDKFKNVGGCKCSKCLK